MMVIDGKLRINAKDLNASLVLILVFSLFQGCVPPPFNLDLSTNPIDVIEQSPRIYHIGFEAIAESLSISLFSDYLERDLMADPQSTFGIEGMIDSAAIVEYLRGLEWLDQGDFDQSGFHLKNAIDRSPQFYKPYILLAGMLRDRGEIKSAMQLYLKVLTFDPTNSRALSGLAMAMLMAGNIENARKAFVDAVIFDRSNFEAWNGIYLIARQCDFSVRLVDVPELSYVKKRGGRHFDLIVDDSVKDCPAVATAWIVYASQRAVWKYEGKYKQKTMKTRYEHTLQEDVDCYMTLAAAWKLLYHEDVGDDTVDCDISYLSHLTRLAEDGYLIPHILFDYCCARDPSLGKRFKPETVDLIRDYINRYVIVPREDDNG